MPRRLENSHGNLDLGSAGEDRDLKQLIADFISALADHLRHILRRKLGEEVLAYVPFEYVITVPAVWSDSAKDSMLKACAKATAGSDVQLIAEPEAAAIFALHGLDPHGLHVGDSFVVCDAGGGTVALITYTIAKLKPVLEIKEAVAGAGALCGSAFLNDLFANMLREKLGTVDGFDDEVLACAAEEFERATKRQFPLAALPDQTFKIPVNGIADNDSLEIRGRWKRISGWELKTRVFEPVVKQVVDLVNEQIFASNVPIRAVCLVGGFGASVYLRERLRQAVDAGIEVMQPSNAWTAVVMGAVMKGLALSGVGPAVRIAERRARKHYGYELDLDYDEDLHKSISHLLHEG